MIMSFGIVDRQGKRFYCLYPNVCQDEAMRLMQRDGGVLIDIDEVPEFEFRFSLRSSKTSQKELPSVRLMERSVSTEEYEACQLVYNNSCSGVSNAYLVRQVFEFISNGYEVAKFYIEVYDGIVADSSKLAEAYAKRMAHVMLEMGYFDDDIGVAGQLRYKGIASVLPLSDMWLKNPSVVEEIRV